MERLKALGIKVVYTGYPDVFGEKDYRYSNYYGIKEIRLKPFLKDTEKEKEIFEKAIEVFSDEGKRNKNPTKDITLKELEKGWKSTAKKMNIDFLNKNGIEPTKENYNRFVNKLKELSPDNFSKEFDNLIKELKE